MYIFLERCSKVVYHIFMSRLRAMVCIFSIFLGCNLFLAIIFLDGNDWFKLFCIGSILSYRNMANFYLNIRKAIRCFSVYWFSNSFLSVIHIIKILDPKKETESR